MTAVLPEQTTTLPATPTPAAARWIGRLPILAYRLGLGDLVNNSHVLILTTRGRSSGQPRHTALEYRAHGSRIYVLSTFSERPHWLQNAMVSPLVTVQRGRRAMSMIAERVTQPGEALLALRMFHGTGPFIYDSVFTPMQALRGRRMVTERTLPQITDRYPLLRLSPTSSASPLPGVDDDLRWVLPAIGMTTVGMAALGAVLVTWRGARGRF